MRWFVLGLIVQSVLLAATGERLRVVAGAVALIVLLAHVRMRPSRRQVMLSRALTMAAVLGITGYRAASGRDLYHQNPGLTARVQAIGSGPYSLGQASSQNGTSPGLVTEVTVRMDGNAFAGGVLQAMSFGRLVPGVGPVFKSVLIAVPSFVWSSKLVYLTGPSPVWTETYDFGLRATNYVPTLLALYIGFIGPYWLMIFLAVIGILCGWGEPWLFRRFTAVRTVVLAAVVEVVFKYEQGLPGMLVALRAVVVLALAVKLIEVAKREASRPSGKLARSYPDLLITKSYQPGSGGRR